MSGIKAIIGLEFRRLKNQFSRLKTQRKGMRQASSTAKKKTWLWPSVFTSIFFIIMLFQFHSGTQKIIQDAHPKELDGKIALSFNDQWTLRHLNSTAYTKDGVTQPLDKITAPKIIEKLKASNKKLDQAAAEKYANQYLKHGMDGFMLEHELKQRINLNNYTPKSWVKLSKMFGIVLLGLGLYLVLTPISIRYRDLASEDTQLEMLFGLPFDNRTILLGRFLSMWFLRPAMLIMVLPLLLMFYINLSIGWLSLVYAILGTLCLGAIAASIELLVETFLRSKGTQRMKKNVQSICLILGTLGLYLGIASMIARNSSIIAWLTNSKLGNNLYLLGSLFTLPATHSFGGAWMLGILFLASALLIVMGIFFSARSLSTGLSSGGNLHAPRKLKTTEFPPNSTVKQKQGGTLKYEWLIISRDRSLMTQLIAFPLLILVYQWMMNPDFLQSLQLLNVSIIAFAIGAIGVTMSSAALVTSDLKSLWVIFTLPIPVSHAFRKRATLWGFILTGLATLVALLLITILKVPLGPNLWRLFAAIASIFVLSRILYAIMLGRIELPDPASTDTIKISHWRMYLCMGIGGILGYYLYKTDPWSVFACLVIFWFLADAIWENLASRMRYIFETVHDIPTHASLSDALKMILIYFIAQTVFLIIFMTFIPSIGVLISFIAAGIVAFLYSLLNKRLAEIDTTNLANKLLTERTLRQNIRHLGAWFVVTSLVAIGWLTLLAVIPQTRELIPPMTVKWYIPALLIIVAPLIEEFIFRKHLFCIMRQSWSFKRSTLSSALLFAAIHPGLSFPPVFLLGIGTAWLYETTGKLRYNIALHAAYNAVVYWAQI